MNFQKGQLIGIGGEKIVFAHPENPELVVAEFRKTASSFSPQQLKGRYYLTKIMHLLFPDAIPDIYLAAKGKQAYLIAQRVAHNAEHAAVQKVDTLARRRQKLPPDAIGQADRALTKMKKNPKITALRRELQASGVNIDLNAFNYTTTPEGKVMYLDNSFMPWSIIGHKVELAFKLDKLNQLINKLPQAARTKALNYLNRCLQLFEEEKQARYAKKGLSQ